MGDYLVPQVLTAMSMVPQSMNGKEPSRSAHWLPWVLLITSATLSAQELMPAASPGGMVRLFTTDAAILESQETRKDLPCTVTPSKPVLGFDLKFHTGYEVSVPLKELAGSENQLTMIFRVSPDGKPDDPIYFSQRVGVPAIDEDERGPAFLQGEFNVGEGKYHVDWLMRDRSERVCSFHWDSDANLPQKDKQIALDISPSTIKPMETELFKQEPPVERDQKDKPLNVKVMINFAPQDSASATLQPLDMNALVSILRSVAREPRIGKFSIVAYNMQEQRVIYRQDNGSTIDFPAIGKSLESLNLGTVDLKRLTQKHGDTEFLSNLITTEIKDPKDQPDAVIFAGPKVMLENGLSADTLKQIGEVKFPVFYMNYNLNPQANPWKDAIGNCVKYLKGVEFTISRPRDLFFAWTDIMGRIVKLKFNRTGIGNGASQ